MGQLLYFNEGDWRIGSWQWARSSGTSKLKKTNANYETIIWNTQFSKHRAPIYLDRHHLYCNYSQAQYSWGTYGQFVHAFCENWCFSPLKVRGKGHNNHDTSLTSERTTNGSSRRFRRQYTYVAKTSLKASVAKSHHHNRSPENTNTALHTNNHVAWKHQNRSNSLRKSRQEKLCQHMRSPGVDFIVFPSWHARREDVFKT